VKGTQSVNVVHSDNDTVFTTEPYDPIIQLIPQSSRIS